MRKIAKRYLGINLKECVFLGSGYEGKVYLTPNGHALKVFKNKNNCTAEYNILKKVEGSEYFPKIIKKTKFCILREYVSGENLKEYIIKNGLSKKLAINLINLVQEFEKLNFKKLDMRGAHIFVQNNEKVKVIDPRKSFKKKVLIPFSLIRDIDKSGALDDFMKVLVIERPDLAILWINAFKRM